MPVIAAEIIPVTHLTIAPITEAERAGNLDALMPLLDRHATDASRVPRPDLADISDVLLRAHAHATLPAVAARWAKVPSDEFDPTLIPALRASRACAPRRPPPTAIVSAATSLDIAAGSPERVGGGSPPETRAPNAPSACRGRATADTRPPTRRATTGARRRRWPPAASGRPSPCPDAEQRRAGGEAAEAAGPTTTAAMPDRLDPHARGDEPLAADAVGPRARDQLRDPPRRRVDRRERADLPERPCARRRKRAGRAPTPCRR